MGFVIVVARPAATILHDLLVQQTLAPSFTNLVRGAPGKLQPPIDDIDQYWNAAEKYHAAHMLKYAIAGSRETVQRGLEEFVELTNADELMIVTSVYDHAARVRSYEIVAEVTGQRSRS